MKKALLALSLLFSPAMYGTLYMKFQARCSCNGQEGQGEIELDEMNRGYLCHEDCGCMISFEVNKRDNGLIDAHFCIEKDGEIIAKPEIVTELGKEATLRVGEANPELDETKELEIKVTITEEE